MKSSIKSWKGRAYVDEIDATEFEEIDKLGFVNVRGDCAHANECGGGLTEEDDCVHHELAKVAPSPESGSVEMLRYAPGNDKGQLVLRDES
ncbi:hypothetical protein HPP92_003310 [Vanilla planifolia]|uniref:Uncharacterized protein n=1 Tax=Vanilla planifolia TaxID=51239 RepID=A0A835RUX2_VANPL|nr:hypothetical protein HPP92_003310 [Vanilla planifolia]